jgi:hypothetical protein
MSGIISRKVTRNLLKQALKTVKEKEIEFPCFYDTFACYKLQVKIGVYVFVSMEFNKFNHTKSVEVKVAERFYKSGSDSDLDWVQCKVDDIFIESKVREILNTINDNYTRKQRRRDSMYTEAEIEMVGRIESLINKGTDFSDYTAFEY